ncbi:hypothetical protein YPPY66_4520, partial [Yersinia pestis PY-66]
MFFCYIIY